MGAYLYLPQMQSYGATNTGHFLNNALEWESRFTLGRNAAKSTACIQKCLKQKLYKPKFPRKNSVDAYLYLPQT